MPSGSAAQENVKMSTEPQRPDGAARTRRDADEAALAVRARSGDRDAFGELVERYADQARRVARAVLQDADDADDAAQDAFLAALVKLHQYDAQRPFGPWLMRIVSNAATDRRRRRTVRRAESLQEGLVARCARLFAFAERSSFIVVLLCFFLLLSDVRCFFVSLFVVY